MRIEPRKPKTEFEIMEAITQPFRSREGRGFVIRLVTWMTVLMTLLTLVTLPFVLPHYGALLEFSWLDMQATLGNGPKPDPMDMMEVLAKIALAYTVAALGMWAILISGETAMHRNILREEDTSKRLLRFGKDELRVFLVQLGVWAIWFVVYILGIVVMVVCTGIFGLVSPVLSAVVMVLLLIVLLCAMVFVPIRLAPAAALSVDRNKRHLLAARHITKHRFWNLFLAYLLVGVVGYMAIYAVFAICMAVVTGDPQFILSMSGLGGENPRLVFEQAAERLKNPVFLVIALASTVVYLALFCTWILCLAGVGTYAVKWWKRDDPTPNFD